MIARVCDQLLMVYLSDNTRARILQPDGSYRRAQPEDGTLQIDSQALFAKPHNTLSEAIPRFTRA